MNRERWNKTCEICLASFELKMYSEGKCPKCGQAYNADRMIVLTNGQRWVLRSMTFDPDTLGGAPVVDGCVHIFQAGSIWMFDIAFGFDRAPTYR